MLERGTRCLFWCAGATLGVGVFAGPAVAESFRGWVDLEGTGAKLHVTNPKQTAKSLTAVGIGPLSSGDLAGMTVTRVYDTGRGAKLVSLRRELGGVPVYGERALLIINASGVPQAFHATLKLRGEVLDSERANIKDFRWSSPMKDISAGTRARDDRWWVPVNGRLVPAFREYEPERTMNGPAVFAYLRSAEDGTVLRKASVTDRAAFGYRVYAEADGHPFDNPFGFTEPHPTGVPDGSAPFVAEPQNVVFVEGLSGVSGDPWLPDDATETVGNNLDVFFNSLLLPDGTYDSLFNFEPGSAWGPEFRSDDGDFRAQAVDGVFDYVYDHSAAPSDFFQRFSDSEPAAPDPDDPQLNAKIVQAFYMGNYLHDFFYDAGFDEAAGNAQQDNFGRGGIGGDPMIVHAGSMTTVIFTPGDGESPVMILGLNNFTTSNKDFGLDWTVFSHEWAHYMVRRLVGGGAAFLANNQGRSINEGWADFVGMFMTVREPDIAGPGAPGLTSSYAVGAYGNRDYFFPVPVLAGTAPADSHFYGIRRWPFGPSNPFTFAHVEHGAAFPGPASDFYDWKGRSRFNSEVHTAGEIWAATVWDCFRDIFEQRSNRGFEANRRVLAEYIVTGMLATPTNPTFTEARDGLLEAMRAADRDDYHICRSAFAARGMGAGAVSPERFAADHAGVVESFDEGPLAVSLVDSELDDAVLSVDGDAILDGTGEIGKLTLTVRNSGFETIRRARFSVPSTADYRILGRAPWVVTNLAPGQDEEMSFRVQLRHDRHYDPTQFTLDFDLRGGRGEHASGGIPVTHRTHFDIESWKGTDNAEFPETFSDWTIERTPMGFGFALADPTWERVERPDVPGDHAYRIGERFAGYDVALMSPPLEIQPGPGSDFEIRFDHAFNFADDVPPVGTVTKGSASVEISTDDGQTWNPVASFFGESAAFPALTGEHIKLGPGHGGTTVRVRFRVLSFEQFQPVEEAWILDNIEFLGLANEPFTRVVAESGG